MFWIVLLVILGAIFLMAELVLLPGVSIGGILALCCDVAAGYFAFAWYGSTAGWAAIAVIFLVAIVVTIISLRATTWQKLSLRQQITSSSMDTPQEHNVRVGDRGVAITRLAPMGKVEIAGHVFEAKSTTELIDQQSEIEVTGFENFNIIVKKVK
ncbi:MAG: serine protease [Rikenellaceae bacterium]|nr:serine protease [Rikenellaceae bacterium]